MDSARFRQRLLDIQAELGELDPRAPDAADRAHRLREEIDTLAADQHQHSAALAARAFGRLVTPTGYDAPVEKLQAYLDSATPPEHDPQAPHPSADPPTPNEDSR